MADDGCDDSKPRLTNVAFRTGSSFVPFARKDIPESCLEHVIDLARLSPSGWNLQPWRCIVVRGETGKQQLEAAVYIKVPLSSAPVVLICLTDTLAWKTAPQRLQELVANRKLTETEAQEILSRVRACYSMSPRMAERAALANAFVALHQMLLASADYELSAYWVTEFDEQKIKNYFHIPDQFLVAALLPIGYRDEVAPTPTPTPPLRSLVYKEKYGQSFNHD